MQTSCVSIASLGTDQLFDDKNVLRLSIDGICCCLFFKLCLTLDPKTIASQAPLSTEFPRQEHWGGLSFTPPGNLPDPRIEPRSPALQADILPSEPPGKAILNNGKF